MEHIPMEARPRAASVTKGERKRLRRAGHVPAALFGKGMDATLVTVEARDVARVLASEGGRNTLVDLSVGGQRHLAKLTEIEIDPLTRTFQHVGLHKIVANEPQKATVPVVIEGEPESVRLNEGLLEVGTASVEVRSLPERLPEAIHFDASAMEMGEVRYVHDLILPDGVELITKGEVPIVSVRHSRAVVSDRELEREEQDTGVATVSSTVEEDLQGV